MVQAESSSSAARNGVKASTAGAPAGYELPWSVSIPPGFSVARASADIPSIVGLKSTALSSLTMLSVIQRQLNA